MSRYKKQECMSRFCNTVEVMPKGSLCYKCEEKLKDYDHMKAKCENLESRETSFFILQEGDSFVRRSNCVKSEDKEVMSFDETFTEFLQSVAVTSTEGQGGFSIGNQSFDCRSGFFCFGGCGFYFFVFKQLICQISQHCFLVTGGSI